MRKIGIFFGTDTGNTRRIAKEIAISLGAERAAKPVNVRTATVADLLQYDRLILGTPTYGDGELPGLATGSATESWAEFLPKLEGHDFTGKTVALYGLGNQKGYPDDFASAMIYLHDAFIKSGAAIVGERGTEGYQFKSSKAIVDDKFVGLALDQENQKELTATRLNDWLAYLQTAWA